MADPIITLTTDFGTRDGYVGAMKGVILRICPGVRVIDLTHQIAPQDVSAAAAALANAVPYFPTDAIHVAVVDPGVGSDRRGIVLVSPDWTLVGPDNGLFAPLWSQAVADYGPDRLVAVELTDPGYHRPEVSPTFHGRDVFAPTAAHLANGVSPATLGPPISDLVELDAPSAACETDGEVVGQIVHVDRFGNCITNIEAAQLEALGPPDCIRIRCAGLELGPLCTTYSDVAPGEDLALIGSDGRLELARRDGDLAAETGIAIATPVQIGPHLG